MSYVTMSHTTSPTSLDVMFDGLANSYRRRILLEIADHNPRDEDEFSPETFTSDAADNDELKQMRAQLFHTHLPKLADAGYIEWDPETETIRRGPDFEEIAPLLTLLVDRGDELPGDWP